jgi:hypothetical protein
MPLQIDFFSLKGPSSGEDVLKYTDTTVVIDGYFRYETELVTKERPVHRFFWRDGEHLFVAITGIRRGKDTSEYWTDEEEGGRICLTPTEIIEMDYEVVETNPTRERYYELHKLMKEEEERYEEIDEELYRQRMRREQTCEWRHSRHLALSGGSASLAIASHS